MKTGKNEQFIGKKFVRAPKKDIKEFIKAIKKRLGVTVEYLDLAKEETETFGFFVSSAQIKFRMEFPNGIIRSVTGKHRGEIKTLESVCVLVTLEAGFASSNSTKIDDRQYAISIMTSGQYRRPHARRWISVEPVHPYAYGYSLAELAADVERAVDELKHLNIKGIIPSNF